MTSALESFKVIGREVGDGSYQLCALGFHLLEVPRLVDAQPPCPARHL